MIHIYCMKNIKPVIIKKKEKSERKNSGKEKVQAEE